MKTFIEEFKVFAMRGNVIDLAVAVVIGAAFSKIVTSLVDNLITPLIGIFAGGISFSDLAFSVGEAVFMYGAFIQSIFDFIIVAFVIFIIVRIMNKIQGEKEKKEAAPAKPSEEVLLLRDIRDSLKR